MLIISSIVLAVSFLAQVTVLAIPVPRNGADAGVILVRRTDKTRNRELPVNPDEALAANVAHDLVSVPGPSVMFSNDQRRDQTFAYLNRPPTLPPTAAQSHPPPPPPPQAAPRPSRPLPPAPRPPMHVTNPTHDEDDHDRPNNVQHMPLPAVLHVQASSHLPPTPQSPPTPQPTTRPSRPTKRRKLRVVNPDPPVGGT